MDLVIAGRDMVALDTVAGLIMGYRPEEVPTTVLAAQMGLGTAALSGIVIAGLPWESVQRRFKRCSESEILKEVPPGSLRIGGGTCSGCQNTIIAVLVELKSTGAADCAYRQDHYYRQPAGRGALRGTSFRR